MPSTVVWSDGKLGIVTITMFALPPESLIAHFARFSPSGPVVWLQIEAYVSADGSSGPGEQVTTGMPAAAASFSWDAMAAEGMPVIPMTSGFCWTADWMPEPGSEALKTRVFRSHPAASTAALTPPPIFSQMGSSHWSQKKVLPALGAASRGVVTLISVGCTVNGAGAEAAAAESSADGEVASDSPHAASPRASTMGSDRRAIRCQVFIGAPWLN
jgi:hypothetical protein